MTAAFLVYSGLFVVFVGLISLVKPIFLLRIRTRGAGAVLLGAGIALAVFGLTVPAPLEREAVPRTRLDEFAPAWQFHEVHEIRVQAPPDRVYETVREVTAREILFFRLLTWIRSPRLPGGESTESILNAPERKPILDVALRSGFVLLADEPGSEIVFGTIQGGPAPGLSSREPEAFLAFDRPGFWKGVMNFRLEKVDGVGTRLSTETRVFAIDASARRRFAAYWRIIYPGSAIIRRMWLRAIKRRAERESADRRSRVETRVPASC
jgi:hypothetical protein